MFLARDSIVEGTNIEDLSYPTLLVNHDYEYTDYDNFSDINEWDHNETIDSTSDYENG
jgi:hypothetical protein